MPFRCTIEEKLPPFLFMIMMLPPCPLSPALTIPLRGCSSGELASPSPPPTPRLKALAWQHNSSHVCVCACSSEHVCVCARESDHHHGLIKDRKKDWRTKKVHRTERMLSFQFTILRRQDLNSPAEMDLVIHHMEKIKEWHDTPHPEKRGNEEIKKKKYSADDVEGAGIKVSNSVCH